ncbi:MAG: gamma carbonic anhydrase family protein [Mariprofundaceae bacterium]
MIRPYLEKQPKIHSQAWIANSAEVIGAVEIGENSSIWYQSVLRGDIEPIQIGNFTNIQEHCTIHTSGGSACTVGNHVTVGHRVILHGCEVGDYCLVGMGSIIMDHAILEAGCLLAAGSLVTEHKVLRSGYLYAGSPARERRILSAEEAGFLKHSALHYADLAKKHAQ